VKSDIYLAGKPGTWISSFPLHTAFAGHHSKTTSQCEKEI